VAYQLSGLVAQFGGELIGDDISISQVATLGTAKRDHIVFVADPKYLKQLSSTQAGAVILTPSVSDATLLPRIVTQNPYLYFARVAALMNPPARPAPGIHPTAFVDEGAEIDTTASIGAHASIGRGAHVGAGTILEAGCRIGDNVQIGRDCRFYSNTVVYHGCQIADRVVVHAGAIIGSDGFGNAWTGSEWFKIPQLGIVRIGCDVEIGASTTIDRGALGDTVIEDGVRLDNQIQIAHNVYIGRNTAMAACVGVAGSARIGANCVLGGSAMILGHVELADRVNVMAATYVSKSIKKAGTYVGQYPVQTYEDWLANASHLRRLDSLATRLKALERRVGKADVDEHNK
jgi:UDP-3-O-[3-hydroxymyristoyl] glucosamine N-acyltransferase